MPNKTIPLLLCMFWLLSACGITPTPQATATPLFSLPAAQASPSPTGEISTPNACPNPDCVFLTPSLRDIEPLQLNLPTPAPEPKSIWRPAQYPVPLALGAHDHFYLARPIAADEINWPIASYRYGGIFFSSDIVHTGVDIPAKAGAPILAAGAGTVVWAGWGLFSGTPDNYKDPYGIAVAIRHDFGYQSQPLYTVYAHLSEADVTPGQWVQAGETIGNVGDTGYTTGPHLHLEVRLGENTYFHTLNPELWIAPPQGWGVLAGRVMETSRKPIASYPILIRSVATGREWTVNTYGTKAINPDPYYNENMVISDLPAGEYTILIPYDTKTEKFTLQINPGQITYFTFRGKYGYGLGVPEITPTP